MLSPSALHGDPGAGPGEWVPEAACRSERGMNSICTWGLGLWGQLAPQDRAGSPKVKVSAPVPALGPPRPAESGASQGCSDSCSQTLGVGELRQRPLLSLDKCRPAPAEGQRGALPLRSGSQQGLPLCSTAGRAHTTRSRVTAPQQSRVVYSTSQLVPENTQAPVKALVLSPGPAPAQKSTFPAQLMCTRHSSKPFYMDPFTQSSYQVHFADK